MKRALIAAVALLAPFAAPAQVAPTPVERPGAAPSYAAPPATYLIAPSQLYMYPLAPAPLFGPPPPLADDARLKPASGADAPLPPVGHVVLMVDPVSAEVTLDGVRLTQRSDLSYAVGLLEGRHEIRVAAAGYRPHGRVLEVKRGVGMFLTVRLNALAAEAERR